LPAIVYAGAFNEPGTLLRRTCGILGVASYAIYVLHFSVSIALKQAWRASVAFEPWSGYLLLVGLIALSLPVDAFYDVPVRQLLRRRA
jgi:peptidoglycan/LPS O-acetylase OafA/YrhL